MATLQTFQNKWKHLLFLLITVNVPRPAAYITFLVW